VPCEVTTYCYYPGYNKDYLVSNAIFRSGGAAMIMTNKPELVPRCKYLLHSATRVHTGQDDAAYKCAAGLAAGGARDGGGQRMLPCSLTEASARPRAAAS
jgi:hypothetical protein